MEQCLAGSGEMQLPPDLLEEPHPEIMFEVLNLTRDRGLGEGELRRGPGVVAVLPDAEKGLEVDGVHERIILCVFCMRTTNIIHFIDSRVERILPPDPERVARQGEQT